MLFCILFYWNSLGLATLATVNKDLNINKNVIRGSVRSGKCLSENVCSGNCPFRELSFGELSVEEMSAGEVSIRELSQSQVLK